MKTVRAGAYDVHYARAHHHVLKAWVAHRRSCTLPPHLVTLDRHTDLRPAFIRNTCLILDPTATRLIPKANIECEARQRSIKLSALTASAVNAALRILAHDEHIDAARRADVIGRVHLLQSSDIGTDVPWAQTMRFDVPDLETAALSLEPMRIEPLIEAVQRGAGTELEELPYILDIDLDYFHSRNGTKSTDPAPFRRLVRNARLITIALEPQCVREPGLLDSGISAKRLLEMLLQEIGKA